MTVDKFIAESDHALKKELIELRKIILSAEKTLTEQIKWNAPSFCHNGDDRITFNIAKKDAVLLIFHRGAKSKKLQLTKPLLEENADLLEWPAPDRGVMKFASMEEVKANSRALKKIVKDWITITAKHAA
jgi:uncharacterized protein YdhG (YjbR/CyaY superfamily)